jgi:hypothetical protein
LRSGSDRTNVWEYRGVNTLKAGRLDELALHPTVKPVAMIADAMKDVSRRGGIVLDLFGGSGSTLIAAHKTGRRARLCELDPIYCDRILRRWEIFAKDDSEHIACGSVGRPLGEDLVLGRQRAGDEAENDAADSGPRTEAQSASRVWDCDEPPTEGGLDQGRRRSPARRSRRPSSFAG